MLRKREKKLTLEWLETRTLLSTMIRETEPNNLVAAADQVQFDGHDRAGAMVGTIATRRDVDTYKFQTGVTGKARVKFRATDGLTGNLTIENAAGQTLLSRQSAGTNVAGRFNVGPNQEFFVKVAGDRRTMGNYEIQIQLPQTTCEILHINIEQLHADLLGLVVDTSEIDIKISGQTGPGKLLGNLACELVGALGGGVSAEVGAGSVETATRKQLQKAVNQVSGPIDAAALPELPAGTVCPILHLDVGPVRVDLLGLVIETNRIIADVNAEAGDGKLLGNLLCSLAHLLDPDQLSATLTESIADGLADGTIDSVIDDTGLIIEPPEKKTCDILSLVLGPVHLDLLGAVVDTNRIELDITGETGPDKLLGNLACQLAGLVKPPTLLSNAIVDVTTSTTNNTVLATTSSSTTILSQFTQPAPVSILATCELLTLHIEELNVNLLGLVIDTGPIDVKITGQTGPGKLLGNLVCSLAGALDGVLTQ